MEHGLDERHAKIFFHESHPPQIRTQQNDVLDALRLQREVHASLLPRRSRTREKFSFAQNARRFVAAVCKPAPLICLSVRPPREKTPLHGTGNRPAQRVERSAQPRLALAPTRFASRRAKSCPRPK